MYTGAGARDILSVAMYTGGGGILGVAVHARVRDTGIPSVAMYMGVRVSQE